MTMYRMRQREFILGLLAASVRVARGRSSSSPTGIATRLRRPYPHAARRSRPRSRTTCWPSSNSSNATRRGLRGVRPDQSQPARRLRDHRHRVSHRSAADERAARLRRRRPATPTAASRRSTTCSRACRAAARAARRSRTRRPGSAALVHAGIRLSAAGDGFVQCSSIMPQKRNPVALEHARAIASKALGQAQAIVTDGPQHAVRRHRGHRRRSAAARAPMFRDATRAVTWLRRRWSMPTST